MDLGLELDQDTSEHSVIKLVNEQNNLSKPTDHPGRLGWEVCETKRVYYFPREQSSKRIVSRCLLLSAQ